jgi:hypothetical protein
MRLKTEKVEELKGWSVEAERGARREAPSVQAPEKFQGPSSNASAYESLRPDARTFAFCKSSRVQPNSTQNPNGSHRIAPDQSARVARARSSKFQWHTINPGKSGQIGPNPGSKKIIFLSSTQNVAVTEEMASLSKFKQI